MTRLNRIGWAPALLRQMRINQFAMKTWGPCGNNQIAWSDPPAYLSTSQRGRRVSTTRNAGIKKDVDGRRAPATTTSNCHPEF